ncbi:NAD(P)/FAD-dependent oxidoreductase [Vallitalea pronyensis]|uniref:NAD(P)/FAD-dependent oxidoreductase n=1 Tax=Vallitalea pronyensis TaxID=1348613 RepID=A0A8J8MN90_9FIRM|nr:NAD(P)/FAD-dependent oxidoreductase [Vallitalea pronyensis]QUI25037.1 NAD(P)/FAD-dependent oxidoreductase [Vallitalea pronyensis]
MYDIIVIGSGPAGYYCAVSAARLGKQVAIVEKHTLGGTGFRWGCLPVKYMLDRVKKIEDVREDLGITVDQSKVYGDIFQKTTMDMENVESKIKQSLEDLHVDIFFGDGECVDRYHYRVGHETLEAKNMVIATGTSPTGIMDIHLDHDTIISHEEAIGLQALPKELIIVGGNVEGIEFASLFTYLDSNVTVIEKEDTILLGNDKDLIKPLEEDLVKRGVRFIKGIGVVKANVHHGCGQVTLEDGQVLNGDKILVTGFRKPNFPKGLTSIGVNTDQEKILVNERLQTNVDNIYAIGDINGLLGMAHVAISQGSLVVKTIDNGDSVPQHYQSLPRAIFTVGEIAGAGYQEWELIQKNIPYHVEKTYFKDTWRGYNKRHDEDFLKVLLDHEGHVLGIWMYGDNVSELVGSLGLLIDKKVTLSEIRESLYVHPTLSEALLETILKF